MRVINNNKERSKIYLRSDIESAITNVTNESNEVHDTIAALNNAVGGSPSGMDSNLIGSCQKTLQDLSSALQSLNRCRELVDSIDTSEEIADEQYK